MSIPTVFSPIQPQDFTLRSIQVHKKFVIQRSDLYSGSVPNTGSGYKLWDARYLGEKMKLGSNTSYPTNSFDGTYKHIIWNSIDAQYYRFPYDKYATLEHSNPRFTFKFLNYSASIISIPQMDFGEGIKPGSVEITSSGLSFNLRDDQNGNVYDSSINTGSFPSPTNLVGYWGFNDQFNGLKQPSPYWQSSPVDSKIRIPFDSKVFQSDFSLGKNIRFFPRFDIDSGYECGLFGVFQNSYILSDNRPDFNFTKNDDFSISFWTYFVDTSGTGSLITKNGTILKQTFGNQKKYNQSDLQVSTDHVSSSYIDQSTNIFPYHFELHDDTNIRFKRSDGINQLSIDLPLVSDTWNHIAMSKTGSNYFMYLNGTLTSSGSNSSLGNCNNDHCLMFGSNNQGLDNSFPGFLDEVRIYNKGISLNEVQTLSDVSNQGLYQTAVVGNVFYKNGLIVVGGINTRYNDMLNGAFTLKFRSTHTIYQYEILTRIKKGSFNLSQNSTARQTPYSDLIINEMTGSLSQGALFPYATSIGYYNSSGELMAVAKLNQPLAMRDDVDIAILTRIDV